MTGSRSLRGRPRPCIRPCAASCVSEGQAAYRTGLARALTELLAPANLAVGQLLVVGWRSAAGPFGPALTLAVPTVGLVTWSRVQLGDHSPAQTLAGAALGGLVAATVFIALR
jgi:hypothetical protein